MHRLSRSTAALASVTAPRLRRLGWLALIPLLLTACDIVNPPEPGGAYVRFENPVVQLNDNTGFTSAVGIRDIWLYHNGLLQGVYPVQPPLSGDWTTVPYLIQPSNSFAMEAGIHESGLGSIHLPYPFWERLTFDVSPGLGDTFVATPVFQYVEEDQYNLEVNESFETNLISFLPFATALTEPDSTFLLRRREGSFQGERSGFIPFGPSDRWFEVISQSNFLLARDKDAYAEITYRNSIEFQVGLVFEDVITGSVGIEPVLTLRPSEQWNTVYVHLIGQARQIINQTSTNTNFWLWIKADGGGQDGFIYLDDVRLIQEE